MIGYTARVDGDPEDAVCGRGEGLGRLERGRSVGGWSLGKHRREVTTPA